MIHLEKIWHTLRHSLWGALLLRPIASIFSHIASIRNQFYDQQRLEQSSVSLPVISVGNITLGGSGKTPFCIWIANALALRGVTPSILSRGYGGSERGPLCVLPSHHPQQVGDEVAMQRHVLPLSTPIVVSRRRVAGAQMIEAEKLAECIILDDGFQHRALKRELDILLWDISSDSALADWISGAVFPLGLLREPLTSALQRAHAVVLVSRGSAVESRVEQARSFLANYAHLRIFQITLIPEVFWELHSGEKFSLQSLEGQVGRVVTAIARPDTFTALLGLIGVKVSSVNCFPDHHAFSREDVDAILRQSSSSIFCTEKDAVKLKDLLPSNVSAYVLRLGLQFESDAEEQACLNFVETGLGHKKKTAG